MAEMFTFGKLLIAYGKLLIAYGCILKQNEQFLHVQCMYVNDWNCERNNKKGFL